MFARGYHHSELSVFESILDLPAVPLFISCVFRCADVCSSRPVDFRYMTLIYSSFVYTVDYV
jgi:hypothetical protein